MDANRVLQFFDEHRRCGEPLVLATVIETRGSTYSKTGEHMLIDADGHFRGMLSGGCLEGDLAMRARVVIESGEPQTVRYNLADGDDEVWGLGIGCDGEMEVLLQLLDDDYEPFTGIASILQGEDAGIVALDIGDGETLEFLVSPPPSVLILGAGLDAEPLVRIASELGWRCTVVDHRPAYVNHGDFRSALQKYCIPAEELAGQLDLARYDMAVVMSHNLASDRSYLRQLAASEIGYVGLLGPGNRRERLLQELEHGADGLRQRLHGPAGLRIGGRGASSIALAIVAEMHAHYYGVSLS
ncbi:MAG: XdhC family protein [Woeseiaceae bacterium]